MVESTITYDPYEDDIDNNPFLEPLSEENSEENKEVLKSQQEEQKGEQEIEHQKVEQQLIDLLPERQSNKYRLLVRVVGLERVGSTTNCRENPTIFLDITTNLPTFRKQIHKNVKKTFREFYELFKFLNSSIPETFVPALPLPSTNFGINNREDYTTIIKNFQQWFNRICMDPFIIRSAELAYFVESDFSTYTPTGQYKILFATGFKRKTLKQLTPPYDEVFDLAEFRPLVKSIHLLSKDIQLKLSKLSRSRKQLSLEENSFGKGFFDLMIGDVKHGKMYHKFGKIIIAISDIDSVIATLDMGTLYDSLEYIINDTYTVKEALTNRHFLMKELLQAQQSCKVRQDQARKLRAKRDVNPLKVDEAIKQLKDATKHEEELTYQLKRITQNMLIEKQQWLEHFHNFLIQSIRDYILRKIEYERKKLSLLEKIRVDIRKVDAQGGLSRLGREKLGGIEMMSPSQSSKGDSWTGDRRISHCITTNEFDHHLGTDGDTNSTLENRDDFEDNSLDPRHAASLLGISTF